MSYERFPVVCIKSDPNDGTVSLTFVKEPDYSEAAARQELAQFSIKRTRGPYEVGTEYWVHLYPK